MSTPGVIEYAPLEDAQRGTPFVYFVLSDSGEVLYIGSTRDLRARLAQHGRTKPWWSDAAHLRAFPHPTLDSALEAEKQYIGVTNPPHNRKLRGPGPNGLIFGLMLGINPTAVEMDAAVFVKAVRESVAT